MKPDLDPDSAGGNWKNKQYNIPREQTRHSLELQCTTANQPNIRTVNGARVSSRNVSPAQMSETKDNDDDDDDGVDRLLTVLKTEFHFNDWKTVEQKLRQIIKEDKLKANDLNITEAISSEEQGSSERSCSPVASAKERHYNIKHVSESVSNTEQKSTVAESVRTSSQGTKHGSQDQYSNVETCTADMEKHKNPQLAAKLGTTNQKVKSSYDSETAQLNGDSADQKQKEVPKETDNTSSRRNKNLRGVKNSNPSQLERDYKERQQVSNVENDTRVPDQTNVSDNAQTQNQSADDTTKNRDELLAAAAENEENSNQEVVSKWIEDANEWRKGSSLPEQPPLELDKNGIPTSLTDQDKFQQYLQQMPILGGRGGRSSSMRQGTSGNAFLGQQAEPRLQQGTGNINSLESNSMMQRGSANQMPMIRGGLPDMFGSPGVSQGPAAGMGAGFGGSSLGALGKFYKDRGRVKREKCLQTCAKCADSDHPAHAQSIGYLLS